MDKKRIEDSIKILDEISNSVKESSEMGQALETALVILEQELSKDNKYFDEQWEIFREKCLVPLEIHITEKHCMKKGAETMNEAWKNFSKHCIESYDALQVLNSNGLIDEGEKAVHEHNLLFEILSIMKTEVED